MRLIYTTQSLVAILLLLSAGVALLLSLRAELNDEILDDVLGHQPSKFKSSQLFNVPAETVDCEEAIKTASANSRVVVKGIARNIRVDTTTGSVVLDLCSQLDGNDRNRGGFRVHLMFMNFDRLGIQDDGHSLVVVDGVITGNRQDNYLWPLFGNAIYVYHRPKQIRSIAMINWTDQRGLDSLK